MKMIRRAVLAAFALGAAVNLSGCAYFQVGEEDFSCSGMPGSVFCHSSRDVYEATNDGVVPSPVPKDGVYNEDCSDCVRAEDVNPDLEGSTVAAQGEAAPAQGTAAPARRQAKNDGDELIDNYVTPALPERPVPIRTPSQVMRIWIASYVDDNGDYVAPGYIYTEIEPRRWVLAKEYERAKMAFDPLAAAEIDDGKAPQTKKDKKGFNSIERLERKQSNKRE